LSFFELPLDNQNSRYTILVVKQPSYGSQLCHLPFAIWEHLTCAMSINAYSSQKLENLEPDHKEK
jgi:hypothetical protein